LYCPLICFRFEDGRKPTFNFIFGTELKAGHTTDDLLVQLVGAQGFPP